MYFGRRDEKCTLLMRNLQKTYIRYIRHIRYWDNIKINVVVESMKIDMVQDRCGDGCLRIHQQSPGYQ